MVYPELPFENLLPVDKGMLEKMAKEMRDDKYRGSEPVTLGLWPDLDGEPVLIDGYMRKRAAIKADITEIPGVISGFPDELAALRHCINL